MDNKIPENAPYLWKDKIIKPAEEDNKYTRGHLLINGSGIECTGATKLAANSAVRAGAGIVTVACDIQSLPIYATSFMSIMAKPIIDDEKFYSYIEDRKVKAVLLGPGNGKTESLKQRVLKLLENDNIPLLIDADAISVFESNPQELFDRLHENCVLTPHAGEFRRLFPEIYESGIKKSEQTLQAAQKCGAVVVYKGVDTFIASPDGRIVINEHAPTSLSTAGTGDVLAGVIAGLLAQHVEAFDAACAGVYVHSKAARPYGMGMMVEDLLPEIGKAMDEL